MKRLPATPSSLRDLLGRFPTRLSLQDLRRLIGRLPRRMRLGVPSVKGLGGLVGLSFVALLVWIQVRPTPSPVLDLAATVAVVDVIELSAPETVQAGEGFEIIADGVVPGTPAFAVIDTGYGLRRFEVTPASSTTTIVVPAETGPASGTVVATVTQGDLVASTTLTIEPGPAVSPVDVYLGPRTVIADAAHFVMIVAVPEDVFGNPVADDTPVDFTTTRPNLEVESVRYPTGDLLAWYEVFSRTKTGRTRVATVTGDAIAPERTFLEVAGNPVPYGLELLDPLLPADGQALVTIGTELLLDPFDNALPDGTVVVLDVEGVTGTRRINSQTVDGRAEFTLEVPDRPGSATAVATASGVSSEPLTLSFTSAIESLTAEIEFLDDRSLVHIGPVQSVRGSFVPEGATATVTAADGSVRFVDLSLGVGTALFPPSADLGWVTVELLGERITVRPNP